MATPAQWYALYDRIAVADEAIKTQLAGFNTAVVAALTPELDNIRAELAVATAAVTGQILPTINEQTTALKAIPSQIHDLTAALTGPDGVGLDAFLPSIIRLGVITENDLAPAQLSIAGSLYNLAYGGGVPNGPINDAMIRLSEVLDQMLASESPNLLDNLKGYIKGGAAWIPALVTIAPYIVELLPRLLPKELADKILNTIGLDMDSVRAAAGALGDAMSRPFDLLVATGLGEFKATLLAGGLAHPSTALDRGIDQLKTAHRLGLAAHTIAAAAEMFTPLKALGFKEAAAAIGDLAGFKPISAAIAGSMVDGAITRPMHFWGNAQFQPEIMPPRDLVEMVHKGEMDLPTYNGLMQFHGYNDADRAMYERTVWRDPVIRDLALALLDSTVDYEWIFTRVKRMGYSDEDAPRLARALFQRSQSASRGKITSAAAAAFSNGVIDEGLFRQTLEDLGLQPETINLEVTAARMRELSDYVAQATTTYKKQYLAGVIDTGAFELALSSLGINPDRSYLIVAEADAQRLPKIQREEEAAVKEEMAAIRTNLVPRYRALYLDHAVSADEYQETLVLAGLDPQLAGQIVRLDTLRRQIG